MSGRAFLTHWGTMGGLTQRNASMPSIKNMANQAACERLKDKLESLPEEAKETKGRALHKALASLAGSKEPITTYKEAIALHNVGPFCAQIICPLREGEVATKPAAARGKKKNTTKKQGPTEEEGETVAAVAGAVAAKPPPRDKKRTNTEQTEAPSAKEKAYQKAKQDAIQKWTHPVGANSIDLVWKVVLLVDNRERESQHILSKCAHSGIPAEERSLAIGDMTWVAQGLRKQYVNGKMTSTVEVELLLGTIIERKTTEDLVKSLFGTRYMEQRLRLQHSGLPQVLFLIEGDIQRDVTPSFPKDRLQMALMETRAQLGFQMVFTKHMDETVMTLKRFHRRILQRTFPEAFGIEDDALPSFSSPNASHSRQQQQQQQKQKQQQQSIGPARSQRRKRRPASLVEMAMDTPPAPVFGQSRFITYTELKCKIERDREAGTKTVGAIHGAMLLQVSGKQKVNAIRETYPTPSSLLQAYDDAAGNPKQQSELVANCIETNAADGKAARRVGPKNSADVCVAYCSTPFERQEKSDKAPGAAVAPAASKRPSPDEKASAAYAAAIKRAKVQQAAPKALSTTNSNATGTTKPSSSTTSSTNSSLSNKQSTTGQGRSSNESCVELLSSSDDDESVDENTDTKKAANYGNNKKSKEQDKENNPVDPKLNASSSSSSTKPSTDDVVVMLEDSSDEEEGGFDRTHVAKKAVALAAAEISRSFVRSPATSTMSSTTSTSQDDSDEEESNEKMNEDAAGATACDAIEID